MGLSLCAVNKNYGFTKDGDEKEDNEEYISTDTGYSSYKFFREDFMKFLTGGDICSFDDLRAVFGDYFYDDKTYVVPMSTNDFDEEAREIPEVKDYIDRLGRLSTKYPKLYDCFAFIEHCDCEGEMPYEQLVSLVPHLKAYHEQSNKKWGYQAWDYDWVQDLIACCEEAIKHKGKLYFC